MANDCYSVYHVESFGNQRNHTGVFVETNSPAQGDGQMFHVEGSIVKGQGMFYNPKPAKKPGSSTSYRGKTFIGYVLQSNIAAIDQVCRTISVPGPQLNLNGKPMNPEVPIRRCTERSNEVIEASIYHSMIRRSVPKGRFPQVGSETPNVTASVGYGGLELLRRYGVMVRQLRR